MFPDLDRLAVSIMEALLQSTVIVCFYELIVVFSYKYNPFILMFLCLLRFVESCYH